MPQRQDGISRRQMLGLDTGTLVAIALGPIDQVLAAPVPMPARRMNVELIIDIVGRRFGVTTEEILSPERTRRIVDARQHGMYVAYLLTRRSLPELGRRFGGRDHTTVLHAVRKIDARVLADASVAWDVEYLIDACVSATLEDGGRIDWSGTYLGGDVTHRLLPGASARRFADKAMTA